MVLLLQTTQAAPSGWDSLRDWVSALGSLSAALIAAVAFLWGLRRRRDRVWAELSHQARRVVAWADTTTQQLPHSPPGDPIVLSSKTLVIQTTLTSRSTTAC
jgi:hypothetical protein